MAYQCHDCSFKGRKFPQGRCPACGSAHVTTAKNSSETSEKRRPWSLIILILLWGYLVYAIYQKLLA